MLNSSGGSRQLDKDGAGGGGGGGGLAGWLGEVRNWMGDQPRTSSREG